MRLDITAAEWVTHTGSKRSRELKRLSLALLAVLASASLAIAGCSQPAPAPTPTKAAAAPAAATAPAAEPTKAAAPATTQPTAAPAAKSSWPEKGKAVTIVVPWAAGSPNDVWARLFASYLEKELGVPIQVLDKPGAAGQIGMTEVAKAKPDGYTLVVNSLQATVLIYLTPDRGAVFTRKDFQPVAVGLLEPFGLVTRGDGPYKTTKDLVDAAKSNPEKVKVGDNGQMSPGHTASVMLAKAGGVKFASVHFNGSNENITALLGGHTDAGVVMASGLQPHFDSGKLRAVGVFGKDESKAFPGTKAMPAQGYDAVMLRTLSIDAPAGTPAEIISTLSKAMKKISEDADYRKKLETAAMLNGYMDTKEYTAHWIEVEEQMKAVIQDVWADQEKKP